jgi:hypothetical protein
MRYMYMCLSVSLARRRFGWTNAQLRSKPMCVTAIRGVEVRSRSGLVTIPGVRAGGPILGERLVVPVTPADLDDLNSTECQAVSRMHAIRRMRNSRLC